MNQLNKEIKESIEILNSTNLDLSESLIALKDSVRFTDDIGVCQPLSNIIKAVRGDKSDVDIYLPYAQFTKYDVSKDKDFILSYSHKDIKYAEKELVEYAEFFQFMNITDEPINFIMELNAGDLTEAVEKYKDLAKKVRDNLILKSSGTKTLISKNDINSAFSLVTDNTNLGKLAKNIKLDINDYDDGITESGNPQYFFHSAYDSRDTNSPQIATDRIEYDNKLVELENKYNKSQAKSNQDRVLSYEDSTFKELENEGYKIKNDDIGKYIKYNKVNVYYQDKKLLVRIDEVDSIVNKYNSQLFRCHHHSSSYTPLTRKESGCNTDGLTDNGKKIFLHTVSKIKSAVASRNAEHVGSKLSTLEVKDVYVGINCGRRCIYHNSKTVGAIKASRHTTGDAVDYSIYYKSGNTLVKLEDDINLITKYLRSNLAVNQRLEDKYAKKDGYSAINTNPQIIKFTQELKQVQEKIGGILEMALKSIGTKIYKTLYNNISGRIESYNINWIPGNSIPISLEGENAPVLQSMGGRSVTVKVNMTLDSPVEVAKMIGMFKVSNRMESSLSMLLLANSIKKTGGKRYKELYNYISLKKYEKTLKEFQGKTIYPELGEPVTIDNQILNSIGISTFLPTAIQIQNREGTPNKFLISMDLIYINTRGRYNESLKHEKNQNSHNLLAIGSKLYGNIPGKDDKANLDLYKSNPIYQTLNTSTNKMLLKKAKFLNEITNQSRIYGFTELISIYAIYRTRILFNKIAEYYNITGSVILNPGNDQSKITKYQEMMKYISIDTGYDYSADPSGITSAAKQYRDDFNIGTLQACKEELHRISKDPNTNSATASVFKSSVETLTEIQKACAPWIMVGSEIISNIGLTLSTMYYTNLTSSKISELGIHLEKYSKQGGQVSEDLNKLNKISKQGKGKTAGIMAAITASLSALPVIGAMLSYDPSLHKEEFKRNGYPLQLQILIATYMYDFFIDYIYHIELDDAESFIRNMCDEVIQYSNISGTSLNIYLQNTFRTDTGIDINNINIGIYYQKTPERFDISVPFIKDISRLNEYSKKIKENYDKQKDNQGEQEEYAGFIVDSFSYYIDNLILLSCHTLYKHLFNSGLQTILNTAYNIINNGSQLKYCTEIVTSHIIGMGILDTSVLISKEMYKKEQSNNKYEEQLLTSSAKLDKHSNDIYCIEMLRGYMASSSFNINDKYVKQLICLNMKLLLKASGSRYYTVGDSAKSSHFQDTMELIDVTFFDIIMSPISQAVSAIVNLALLIVTEAFIEIVIELILIVVVGISAAIAGVIAIIVGIVIAIVMAIPLLIDWLTDMSVNFGISMAKPFSIGYWIRTELSRGFDDGTVLELCDASNIWLISLLNSTDNKDVFDPTWTSYMDYPVIVYKNKPLMPDAFMYKIGFLNNEFQELKQMMIDIIDINAEAKQTLDGSDFNRLLEENTRMMSRLVSGLVQGYEIEFRNILEEYIYNGIEVEGKRSKVKFDNKFKNRLLKLPTSINKNFVDCLGIDILIDNNRQNDNSYKSAALIVDIFLETIDSKDKQYSITGVKLRITKGGLTKVAESNKFLNQTSGNDPFYSTRCRQYFSDNTVGDKVLGEISYRISSMTVKAIETFYTQQEQLGGVVENKMPNTYSNLLFLKQMVGSSMKQIGKPGVAYYKNLTESIGVKTLLRTTRFRSNYLFPTAKLYFIEEDNEAFYMFDDLYSYASIVDIRIHEEEGDCLQTCVLKVTNLYNKLSNVVVDNMNSENYFMTGGDEATSVNALLLKPGCKIKLQLGYTPIFSERNTKFTGEIVDIQFGQITTITAQSYGAKLHAEISKEKVETISPVKYTSNIIDDEQLKAQLMLKITSRIKQTAGSILDKITLNGTFDDLTINPDLAVIPDSELIGSTPNEDTKAKHKISALLNKSSQDIMGTDVSLYYNRQLYENIYLKSSDVDLSYNGLIGGWTSFWETGRIAKLIDKFFGPSKHSWVTYNETGWESLKELNRVLPNYRIATRPYDTRSTLVWGDDETYYKYKRSVNINSLAANRIVEIFIEEETNQRSEIPYWKIITNVLDQIRQPMPNGSAISIYAYMVYYANLLYESIIQNEPVNGHKVCKLKISEDILINSNSTNTDYSKILSECIAWHQTKGKSNGDKIDKFKKTLEHTVRKINEFKLKVQDDETLNVSVKALFVGALSSVYSLKNIGAAVKVGGIKYYTAEKLKAYCFYLIGEEYFENIRELVISRADSYRKFSEDHIKTSGVDIIKNNIVLNKPFNHLRLTVPPEDSDVESNVNPSYENITHEFPYHYKLKPSAYNTFSAYYKNINFIPNGTTSLKGMIACSYMREMMANMYSGDVQLLIDPDIYPGDKIFLYDYINDYYGIVRVKSHDLIISPEEGAKSIIQPAMISSCSNRIEISTWSAIYKTGTKLLVIATIVATAFGLSKGAKTILRRKGIKNALSTDVTESKIPLIANLKKSINNVTLSIEGGAAAKTGSKISAGIRKVRKVGEKKKSFSDGLKIIESMPNTDKAKIGEAFGQYAVGYGNFSKQRIFDYLANMSKNDEALSGLIVDNKLADDLVTELSKAIENVYSNSARKLHSKYNITSYFEIGDDVDNAVVYSKDYIDFVTESLKPELNSIISRFIGEGVNPDIVAAITKNLVDDEVFKTTLIKNFKDNKSALTKNIDLELNKLQTKFKDAGIDDNTVSELKNLIIRVEANDAYMFDLLIDTGKSLLGTSSSTGKVILGAGILGGLGHLAYSICNWASLLLGTSNSVTISPLWYRGEPFVAGLDGVEKQDTFDASPTDIMKARFSGFFESLGQFNDPFQDAKYKYIIDNYRNSRQSEINDIISKTGD